MCTKTNTKVFISPEGGIAEYHVMVSVTDPDLPFSAQMDAVLSACEEASQGRTVHFRRFFLSDAANQFPALGQALAAMPYAVTSFVHQPPLDGTRIALWMYCTSPMDIVGGVPSHNGYSHHWSGSMVSPGADSYEQMSGIFRTFGASLADAGLSVASDTVRTWIFARDVDVYYRGVVVGRREYFDGIGLTSDTHYIASTGIEGRHPDCRYLVEMDAYSVGGLEEGQVSYLYARDHLSPTSDYGVTFERGTAVAYGDRRHVFISGTASIDSRGQVVHPGDVAAQTDRMLENISALLAEAGASPKDICMAVVYLRDSADYQIVKNIVSSSCPGLDALYVFAPVCRPAWLVEMECIAIVPVRSDYPVF